MSDKSRIEWTEATWNPVTGCAKVSQGCKNCYALRDWARLSANPGTVYYGREFTDVRTHPERLDQPLRWTKPRRVFVNSMSDLFHEAVPDEFIDRVFAVMALSPRHTFQVLTKRPERMREYFKSLHSIDAERRGWNVCEWAAEQFAAGADGAEAIAQIPKGLPNVWLGVSVEDQATADERIPLLLQTPAAVRWISAEPLLGPVMLDVYLGELPEDEDGAPYPGSISWVVVGGESGPKARPMHPEWAGSLRDQCQAAGVPFFFKQWGEWAPASVARKFDHWSKNDALVKTDGTAHAIDDGERYDASDVPMLKIGKKAAGRLLDGRTWDEYPR